MADLHTAALLCEAAYRTQLGAEELNQHLDTVRLLLSSTAAGEVSIHNAGDQR